VIWNIEQGLKLTGEAIARAQELRTQVFHRMRTFSSATSSWFAR